MSIVIVPVPAARAPAALVSKLTAYSAPEAPARDGVGSLVRNGKVVEPGIARLVTEVAIE